MLVYTGEDHGLRKKQNQIDYHRRILEWFDHYLKGDAAQPWITEGVSYVDRDDEEMKQNEAGRGKGKPNCWIRQP